MERSLLNAIKNRRSYYSLGNEKIVGENKIIDIINNAVKYTPSSFNAQSSRAILLLNAHHEKFWEMVKAEIKKAVSAENFEQSKQKIDNSFKSGYGTILYFEDMDSVKELQERFPLYSDNFPIWANHTSGMLQFIIWSALEMEGLGASLQHYNQLIEESVKKEWELPNSYKLIAQMPFGKPLAEPDEKTFIPIEQRVKVFK